MIVVAVGGRDDFRISQLEAKLLDTRLDLLRGVANAGVDQDISLWSDDEIGRQVVAADPVDVPDDPERREWARPLFVLCRGVLRQEKSRPGERKQAKQF